MYFGKARQYDWREDREKFHYKCSECEVASSEYDWNETTWKQCKAVFQEDLEHWEDDEGFYPLAREYHELEGAWFYCPNCHAYHDDSSSISRVYISYENNKQAKMLLDRSW